MDARSADLDDAEELRRTLDHLASWRRTSRTPAIEVGRLVYAYGQGSDWSFHEWIRWFQCVPDGCDAADDPQSAAELAFEWQVFGQGDETQAREGPEKGTDGEARAALFEMIRPGRIGRRAAGQSA